MCYGPCVDPKRLREQAEQKRSQAAQLIAEAHVLETAAAELERLQVAGGGDTMVTMPLSTSPDVQRAQRVRISQGRLRTGDLDKAIGGAGFTLRTLAEKLAKEGHTVDHTALSRWKNGARAVPPEVAAAVEKLTGYPRTAWPKIRSKSE